MARGLLVTAALCGILLSVGGCGEKRAGPREAGGHGPAPARDAKPDIAGFLEVPFGATREQVIARLGPPRQEVGWEELGTLLVYPPRTLFAQEAEPDLVVHPHEGLVQGEYQVRVSDFAGSCETVYRQLAAAVIARYPRIEPKQTRRQDGGGPFCDAVLEGRASAVTLLADPANGATVRVILQPGRPVIYVTYVSAAGQRLTDARADRELRKNF